jgi:hypothetical protein
MLDAVGWIATFVFHHLLSCERPNKIALDSVRRSSFLDNLRDSYPLQACHCS